MASDDTRKRISRGLDALAVLFGAAKAPAGPSRASRPPVPTTRSPSRAARGGSATKPRFGNGSQGDKCNC